MINLLVDEAYAFDYLAILEVKNTSYPSAQKHETFLECKEYLKNQINNFDDIYYSKEYRDLVEINKLTFDLIDDLREGLDITAKSIDDANMDRYYRKKALQENFFSNKLKEEKIVK